MKAELVHQIAKELSYSELERLYLMIEKDLKDIPGKKFKKTKKPTRLTDREAMEYLLKNVF
ncbi:hypothetical protein [Urechidicola vernalis]|uniref:Transposase n=1 Tax=Urechidicola vernalis TaxID=3075600 RepID=A0ABU2Y1R7_9FLAO|nr:hypothetical protein [Urechidicola sp. P050]MDT0552110.1 hypothetical protein [Urechidicola sp. P050]